MNASSSRRGQTLVLFALTLLLLALMGVMTLSFSVKVRERIELQMAADATAFTNAVATARTFNNIAVLSRAQIAHGVAQLGAQSLVNWATLYRAHLMGAMQSFGQTEQIYRANKDNGCPCALSNGVCAKMCECGKKGLDDLSALEGLLLAEDQRVGLIFLDMEPAAGWQVRAMQLAQLAMYAEQQEVYQRLVETLGTQGFAGPILDKLSEGGTRAEWSAPPEAGFISKEEVSGGMFCAGTGAVCSPLPTTVAHAANAAMGSRGWRFTTHRKDYLPHWINLQRVIPPPDLAFPSGEGKSSFKDTGVTNMMSPYATSASAWDEGSVLTVYNHMLHGGKLPCPPVWISVVDRDQLHADLRAGIWPVHTWTRGKDKSPFIHFLVPCTGGRSSCPGVWPAFLDYNMDQVVDVGNNYGQPKNFALIRRDSSVRPPDPWNLLYSLQFTSTRFEALDARLNEPFWNTATALATGVAYYHRGSSLPLPVPILGEDHWNEPPNLLNPYWRATLVAPDVDGTGLVDAVTTLNSAAPAPQAEAFLYLLFQGYGGYHP